MVHELRIIFISDKEKVSYRTWGLPGDPAVKSPNPTNAGDTGSVLGQADLLWRRK